MAVTFLNPFGRAFASAEAGICIVPPLFIAPLSRESVKSTTCKLCFLQQKGELLLALYTRTLHTPGTHIVDVNAWFSRGFYSLSLSLTLLLSLPSLFLALSYSLRPLSLTLPLCRPSPAISHILYTEVWARDVH